MKGRQVVWTGPGVVTVEEKEVKEPGAGQVLVKSKYTLISPGTERAFLLAMPNTSARFPCTSGYNNVGEIVELGEGVEDLKVGDLVASSGSHSEYVIVSEEGAIPIDQTMDLRQAAAFNMVAIALQGVRKAQIELGEPVLVIGLGMVGNLALQLSRLSGGLPVGATDTEPSRLELAKACGADFTFNAREEDLARKLKDLTVGGPAVVFESTGHPAPVNDAFQYAGWRGRVVLLASTRGETEKVNFYRDVHKKGLTILGAHAGVRPRRDNSKGFWNWPADCKVALELIASERLQIEPLISHEHSANDAAEAYNLLVKWLPEFTGGLLNWDDS
ncbi:MAG: zinc-binding alcohol dehydrogenase [Planctomycetota bacterium]|nr:zinc-binding alcohol dehydrogenase [Planctomycetota bacterium]